MVIMDSAIQASKKQKVSKEFCREACERLETSKLDELSFLEQNSKNVELFIEQAKGYLIEEGTAADAKAISEGWDLYVKAKTQYVVGLLEEKRADFNE